MRNLTHLLLSLLPIAAHAQLLTNNGAMITTTAAVHVNGSALNEGGGQIANEGTLTLTGDWTNNAGNNGFGMSQGTVALVGAAQSIAGSSVTVLNNLTLAGTGTKTLQQHAEVGGAPIGASGVLALNDRPLDLNGYNLTVRNAAPTAITRTSGFIVSERDPVAGYSRVRWNIGAGTAGNAHVIPFGNDATGHYLPFSATIATPGGGLGGYLSVATYPTSTLANPNNRPLPSGLPTLIDVSGMENAAHVLDRWWVLETGGYLTAPVASLAFTYRDSEWNAGTNTIVENNLQLERFTGSWSMVPTVINIAANTLSAAAMPLQPGIWTAAEFGSPLPVELLSFSAERSSAQEVELRWATAIERNNAGFEVWRMVEGEEEFKHIGWVDGMGTTQQLTHYNDRDGNASSHMSYYRLKQVDHDGGFVWSDVAAVEGASRSGGLSLYPNPADQWLTISAPWETSTLVRILDAGGREVRVGLIGTGQPSMQLAVGDLAPGAYTVIALAEQGTARETSRLVIAH
jgi:hypothetical protein